MQNKILVIDYKVGNHQSVINALNFLGYDFMVSNKRDDIIQAPFYILPGVGAFAEAMRNLHRMGIIEILQEEVLIKKKPLLGICLGMQVLAEDSQENGFHKGLGWIKGHVVRLKEKKGFRVPHVGWNNIRIKRSEPLFMRTKEDANFYFDHSYHFVTDGAYISATCDYGSDIVASVQKDNIFGVQFHPEKSQTTGLKLFRSFFNCIEKAYSLK